MTDDKQLSKDEKATLQRFLREKKYRQKRNQKPEVKAKQREYHRKRYNEQKAAMARLRKLAADRDVSIDDLIS